MLLFPQILYYFSICTIFYIYFTIASRENNYSQCRYGLINILYKSYLRNYKKLLFMQITKSWLELFKQSYFFFNLIVTSFFDNRIYILFNMFNKYWNSIHQNLSIYLSTLILSTRWLIYLYMCTIILWVLSIVL